MYTVKMFLRRSKLCVLEGFVSKSCLIDVALD